MASRDWIVRAFAIALLTSTAACGSAGGSAPGASPGSAPGEAAAPRDPRHVLLIGDSVMFDATPALTAAFAAMPGVTLTAQPAVGMGLGEHAAFDWRRGWGDTIARERPDEVVLLIGAWDVGYRTIKGADLYPGMPGWNEWYAPLALEAAQLFTSTGAELLWVGMLPQSGDSGARVPMINRIFREVAERVPGVTYLDTARVVGDREGRFAARLPGAGGALEQLRKPDGIHLCPAGAERLAAAVTAELAEEWGVPAPTGWQDGPWRDDHRYYGYPHGDPCERQATGA